MINSSMFKKRIKELGLTQKELAKRANIPYSSLNKKINNRRFMNCLDLYTLSELLFINTEAEIMQFFLDF